MPLSDLRPDSRRYGAGLTTLAVHLALGLLLVMAFRSRVDRPPERDYSDPLVVVPARVPPPPLASPRPTRRQVRHRSPPPQGAPLERAPLLSPPPPAPVPIVTLPRPLMARSAAGDVEGGGLGGNGSGNGSGNGPGGSGGGGMGEAVRRRSASGAIYPTRTIPVR